MNGNNRLGYRPRNDKTRYALIGGIVVVAIAIAIVGFFIAAELGGWFEGGGATKDPLSEKFAVAELELQSSDVHKGDLILVNNTYKYVFPETAPSLVPVISDRKSHGTSASGYTIFSFYTQSDLSLCAKVDEETHQKLLAFTDGFYTATSNSDLFIFDEDGYRTEADQNAKHNAKPTEYSAAGTSEHHTGKVVDFYVYTGTSRGSLDDPGWANTFKWVYDNAYKYGFIHRYPTLKEEVTGVDYEPYHFRQVGYAHAYYMTKNDLCLEEYLELLKTTYTPASPLEFRGDDGNSYMVYYVAAAEGETTKLTVPAELEYTVSGDNMGGFIVTVNVGA